MIDLYNSLPQFLQLCVGLGVVLLILTAGRTALNMRKAQSDANSGGTDLDTKLALIYEKMAALSQRHDVMIDHLEIRVRANEIDVAGLKARAHSK